MKLIVGDASSEHLSIERAIDLVDASSGGNLFLEVSGDVTQTVSGTIEASGLALLVGGLATLDMGNDVDTLASQTVGELLYRDVDEVTVGSVSVDLGVSVIGGQLDLDGDGDIDVNDSGTVWGLVGSYTVNSEITVINGGLDVDGDNDVDGDDDGTVNGIAVADGVLGTVPGGVLPEQVIGITSSGDDVKLIVGDASSEHLSIERAIDLVDASSGGNLFLEVSGDVTQTVSGTIEASGLALLVGGLATLDMGNDVDTLASQTEGELLYRDVDDVTVGSVSVDLGVSVIGGQLDLDGDGDIDVNDSWYGVGLVGSDTVNSEITVINGGLDVDGDNDVDGDDDGTVNGIAVADGVLGTVPGGVLPEQVIGITSSGDDVKLIVGDASSEHRSIERAIDLVDASSGGNLFLEVSGDVTQTVSGTIEASGLALLVGGLATLDMGNDVDTLASQTEGELLYRDVDDVTVGSGASVDLGVSVIGGQLDLDGDGDIGVNGYSRLDAVAFPGRQRHGQRDHGDQRRIGRGRDNDVDGDDDGTVNGIAVADGVLGTVPGGVLPEQVIGITSSGDDVSDRGGCVE